MQGWEAKAETVRWLDQLFRWIGRLLRTIFKTKVAPGWGLTVVLTIRKDGDNMERFLFSWVPSPSSFSERQALVTSVNGGPQTEGAELPRSASQTTADFETGSTVVAVIRTWGDNGSVADSNAVTFVASNGEAILPATGLKAEWQAHIP